MKQAILALSLCSLMIFLSCGGDDTPSKIETVVDIEGNEYLTIQIGDQIWMAENLKTTKYNDGTSIENGGNDNWSRDEGRYQWASTSDMNNAVEEDLPFDYYGVIYNYAAAESGKLAPVGWKIPSEDDWNELLTFLANNGYSNKEGKALKSTSGWVNDGHGDDAFGFNALPAGYVDTFGTPKVDGIVANWMVMTPNDDFTYVAINLLNSDDEVLVDDASIWFGTSIRCIKE